MNDLTQQKKLPKTLDGIKFEYIQGITFADCAQRVYQNKELGLSINLVTPRKRGKWGVGKKYYSLIGSKKDYESYQELYESEPKGLFKESV